jgi:hypothetical protein
MCEATQQNQEEQTETGKLLYSASQSKKRKTFKGRPDSLKYIIMIPFYALM